MKTSGDHDDLPAMEHSLFRIIVGLFLVAVLFFYAVRYFSKLYDDVSNYQNQMLAERFASSISHVRQHWLAIGKSSPFKLEYEYIDKQVKKLTFHVNRYGWVINVGEETPRLNCQNLWDYLTSELNDGSEPLFKKGQKLQVIQKANGCQFYQKNAELIFSYDSFNGQVSGLNGIKSENKRLNDPKS